MKLEQYFCPNEECQDYGMPNKGNISVRGKYGKNKDRPLLYCRTCGKRFAATQSSAMFGLHLPPDKIREIIRQTSKGVSVRKIGLMLELDKDTVNRVLQRADEQCATMLGDLLTSLEMTDSQLKDLLGFIKNRRISAAIKTASRVIKDDQGSEPPSVVG